MLISFIRLLLKLSLDIFKFLHSSLNHFLLTLLLLGFNLLNLLLQLTDLVGSFLVLLEACFQSHLHLILCLIKLLRIFLLLLLQFSNLPSCLLELVSHQLNSLLQLLLTPLQLVNVVQLL